MNKPKKVSTICTGAVTLALLVMMPAPHIGQELALASTVSPVSAFTKEDRAILSPESKPALVGEKTVKVELISDPPTEIDFETPKPSDRPTDLTSKEPPMGNPTHEPSSVPTPRRQATVEPKMGDTQIIDGQKQVYFLGFGWIEDNDTPNGCVYVEDMYENGNKVGSMGGGTFVDGDGDINKMVGTMDAGETGRSYGDINK